MRTVFQNQELQAQFETEGYIIVPNFLNGSEVKSMIREFDLLGDDITDVPFSTSTMTSNTEFRVGASSIVEKFLTPKAAEILEDYRWFFGNFLMKYRSKDNPKFGSVGLHQDPSFLDESEFEAVNIWIPLVDTDESNGAMQIIKNTHRLNMYPRGFGESFPYLDLESQFRDRLVTLKLPAGHAIILNPRLIHGTDPNRSDSPRYAVDGVFGPGESEAWYYYFDRDKNATIEVFEVDSAYYVEAPFCTRPPEAKYRKIREIPVGADHLDAQKLEQVLGSVTS